MTVAKPSRRHFLQLSGGLAFALRHGLAPATPGTDSGTAFTSFGDTAIRFDWDANFKSRVLSLAGTRAQPLTAFGSCDYLLRSDGRHVEHFSLQHKALAAIADAHGPGSAITLTGLATEGLEKTLSVRLYQRYPGFAIFRVAYRNVSGAPISLQGWTNGDVQVDAGSGGAPQFWCYSGASYSDRRDWVQPVKRGFTQDNFLGMQAPDYGGGTPIVDVWRRDAGLAVGHLETSPRLVSLPVQEGEGRVRVGVCSHAAFELAPGAQFSTPETFVAVHQGDYFATLRTYRLLMADQGMAPAHAGPASYEPIWCAWGYERECTSALIEGTLPKVRELGLDWAVIDDGWQQAIGDWRPNRTKYPNGEADLKALVTNIREAQLKPRLWYSPLSVAPGTDLLHDHSDLLLLDEDGSVQKISWWNSFYLCPAYAGTIQYTQGLIRTFLGDWGFAGLKIDGQHLNGVAPCFNPAHKHARPEESVEGLQNFYRAIYETAMAVNPDAVIELCPCGTAYCAFNFPYMNQAPASDPESSWQVRLKGKTLKGLMGQSAPFAGDHVELSDNQNDFASTIGVGAIVSTKFTWPVDPKPKDSFLLTPDREQLWRHWIALYREKMLPLGIYRGELYDIGFDKPEAHAIERPGAMCYAFYAPNWSGEVALRGLMPGTYKIRDYYNGRDLGMVSGTRHRLAVNFEHFLLLEAVPA